MTRPAAPQRYRIVLEPLGGSVRLKAQMRRVFPPLAVAPLTREEALRYYSKALAEHKVPAGFHLVLAPYGRIPSGTKSW